MRVWSEISVNGWRINEFAYLAEANDVLALGDAVELLEFGLLDVLGREVHLDVDDANVGRPAAVSGAVDAIAAVDTVGSVRAVGGFTVGYSSWHVATVVELSLRREIKCETITIKVNHQQ